MNTSRVGILPCSWVAMVACLTLACASGTEEQEVPDTAPPAEATMTVEVLMETDLGTIRLELYPEQAPATVANFLTYVDGGLFEGATFYRTVTRENDKGDPPIQVIQGGLYLDEPPIPPVVHESTAQTGLLHRDGSISMARAEVGTAGSEFFICVGDQPGLDHGALRNPDGEGFSVFGKVIEGMDVVRGIHGSPADGPTDSEYMAGQMLDPRIAIVSLYRPER